MRRSELGMLFRLAGPLIQVVCLLVLFGTTIGQTTMMGIGVDDILVGGFFLGLVFVVIGLILSFPSRRSR